MAKLIHLKISVARSVAAFPPSSAAFAPTTAKSNTNRILTAKKEERFASSSFSRGSAGTRRGFEDAARDFGGKFGDGGFHLAAGSGKFSRHARFRGANFARGARARVLDPRGAFIEKFLASGLLLGIHLAAGLLEAS